LCIEKRLDHLHDRLLHDAIGHNGDTERPTLLRVSRFRDIDPENWVRLEAVLSKFALDLSQVNIQVRFEHTDRHPVETVHTFVRTHFAPRPIQVLPVVDLVD
jgi:hypothetical protein